MTVYKYCEIFFLTARTTYKRLLICRTNDCYKIYFVDRVGKTVNWAPVSGALWTVRWRPTRWWFITTCAVASSENRVNAARDQLSIMHYIIYIYYTSHLLDVRLFSDENPIVIAAIHHNITTDLIAKHIYSLITITRNMHPILCLYRAVGIYKFIKYHI